MTSGLRWSVIACGEPERGDDGVALDVVARLDPEIAGGVAIRPVRQLSPEDLVDALDAGRVLLLDAVRGIPAGTVIELPLGELRDRPPDWSATTHVLPIGSVVRLAAALGAPLEHGWFIGIGGTRFDLGAGLSSTVHGALPRCVALVEERLGEAG